VDAFFIFTGMSLPDTTKETCSHGKNECLHLSPLWGSRPPYSTQLVETLVFSR
jgi:hypothetical protein